MKFHLFQKKLLRQRTFQELLIGSTLVAVVCGFLIVPIERQNPFSTIQTYEDGLWWSIQTLTTVGYGDVTPSTSIGRLLGILMQLVGAVMFGAVIAIISSSMGRKQEEVYWGRLFERLDQLETKTESIEKETEFLIKETMLTKHKP